MTARLLLLAAVLAAPPASAKDKPPVDPNKKVCRTVDATGTILGGRRVCHTYAEWQEIDHADQAGRDHVRDGIKAGVTPPLSSF